MRTFRDVGDRALETRCNDMLLGRLGRELATVYHDTLDQPLPAALQQLTDRLEGQETGVDREASLAREQA